MERRWSTVACASTMESLKSSTGNGRSCTYCKSSNHVELDLYLFNCVTPLDSALTTWRPVTAGWWLVQCCASLSATSVEPLVMSPTPSGWLLLSLFRVLLCCTGIVLWTRMVPSAMGQVCLSSRPGEMLLATSPPAGCYPNIDLWF